MLARIERPQLSRLIDYLPKLEPTITIETGFAAVAGENSYEVSRYNEAD